MHENEIIFYQSECKRKVFFIFIYLFFFFFFLCMYECKSLLFFQIGFDNLIFMTHFSVKLPYKLVGVAEFRFMVMVGGVETDQTQ